MMMVPISRPQFVDLLSCLVSSGGMPISGAQIRHSSDSFLIEEQPSWLEELLSEPPEEPTPAIKGHRRSSSDSGEYFDASAKNIRIGSADWGSNPNSFEIPSRMDTIPVPISRLPNPWQEFNGKPDPTSARTDYSQVNPSASRADSKCAKQQLAQRSRVRKMQYIAELERNVQALQVEGSEVSAALEFLDQQNLILGLENRALKQRLETLSQEQLIKHMEHDILERELGRLQLLFQQQQHQQQQQKYFTRRRTKSRDLESQFANFSL